MPEPADAEPLAEAARAQLEREFDAREQLARGCGLALIELSSVLEDEDATLDRDIDPLGVALVGFAARGAACGACGLPSPRRR